MSTDPADSIAKYGPLAQHVLPSWLLCHLAVRARGLRKYSAYQLANRVIAGCHEYAAAVNRPAAWHREAALGMGALALAGLARAREPLDLGRIVKITRADVDVYDIWRQTELPLYAQVLACSALPAGTTADVGLAHVNKQYQETRTCVQTEFTRYLQSSLEHAERRLRSDKGADLWAQLWLHVGVKLASVAPQLRRHCLLFN